jgi:hypothetical protein
MGHPIVFDADTMRRSEHGIYVVDTVRHHPVGTRGQTEDGRTFYYSVNTTANTLTRAQLLVAPDFVANHEGVTVNAAGDYPIGVFDVTVTSAGTAIVQDEYAEGFVGLTNGTGEGYYYRIKRHPALAGAGTMAVTLYDLVIVGSDATSENTLIHNRFRNPQTSVADQLDVLAGVPAVTVGDGSTTPQYFWTQTWGEALVLCDEAIATVGQALTTGTGTVGAVEEDDTATTVSQEPLVGYNLTPFVDGEHQFAFLTIAQ